MDAALQKLILVIEDDRALQKVLKRLFEYDNLCVQLASNGNSGLRLCREVRPSIVLLDLGLPDISGLDVCRKISRFAPELPVIVVSAMSDIEEKVLLLELGARDYVTKPFSPRELLARVHAALRRQENEDQDLYAFGDLTVSISRRQVTRKGKSILLTTKEFEILKFMLHNVERVISRRELLGEVWGYKNYATRTVDEHMYQLRNKLERDPSHPVHFRTVHGSGYRLVR